jgi:hypothetical protein
MRLKGNLISVALCGALLLPKVVFALTATGEGSAPKNSSDSQSVRASAEKKATTDAVLQAIKKTLGSRKLTVDSSEVMDLVKARKAFLKSAPTFEIDRSDPSLYAVTATLDIDETKFSEELANVNLGLSTNTGNLGRVVIFIYDTTVPNKPSASEIPMDVKIDHKRDNSKSYKENNAKNSASSSAASMSVSDKESASYSGKSSASGKANSEAAYDQKYAGKASSSAGISGSGGSAYAQDNASVSASSKGSAKQSASYANSQESKAAYDKNYQASASSATSKSASSSKSVNSQVNDKEEFHYSSTVNSAFFKPSNELNDDMKNQLSGTLKKFGVEMQDGTGVLEAFSKFSKLKVPYKNYPEAMQKDGINFKKFIKKQMPNVDYVGIGSLTTGYATAKDNVGDFRCGLNGSSISVSSLNGGSDLASGGLTPIKTSDDMDSEKCVGKVRIAAAEELGRIIGAAIEKEARKKIRKVTVPD